MASSREDCITCLEVYYGLKPYEKHTSRDSGYFYEYIKIKYGIEMLEECEEEIKLKGK